MQIYSEQIHWACRPIRRPITIEENNNNSIEMNFDSDYSI